MVRFFFRSLRLRQELTQVKHRLLFYHKYNLAEKHFGDKHTSLFSRIDE